MRRISAFALLAVALLVAQGALGSSIHLKGGAKAKPAYRDNGLTLTGSASLAGLGNADVSIVITAVGKPRATCTNPSGANQPPGQNPAPVTLTGATSIPASAIKNGELTFSVTTQGPVSPIPGAPDCPNRLWTETIVDVAFTSATIVVTQGAETFTINAWFNPATANGAVPSKTVSFTVA